jgi:hypothetical protein
MSDTSWEHNGVRYVTMERRIWRWRKREFKDDGWIIHWWSPWSWLRPRARKHVVFGGINKPENNGNTRA